VVVGAGADVAVVGAVAVVVDATVLTTVVAAGSVVVVAADPLQAATKAMVRRQDAMLRGFLMCL
jgi:hypothetical protein